MVLLVSVFLSRLSNIPIQGKADIVVRKTHQTYAVLNNGRSVQANKGNVKIVTGQAVVFLMEVDLFYSKVFLLRPNQT